MPARASEVEAQPEHALGMRSELSHGESAFELVHGFLVAELLTGTARRRPRVFDGTVGFIDGRGQHRVMSEHGRMRRFAGGFLGESVPRRRVEPRSLSGLDLAIEGLADQSVSEAKAGETQLLDPSVAHCRREPVHAGAGLGCEHARERSDAELPPQHRRGVQDRPGLIGQAIRHTLEDQGEPLDQALWQPAEQRLVEGFGEPARRPGTDPRELSDEEWVASRQFRDPARKRWIDGIAEGAIQQRVDVVRCESGEGQFARSRFVPTRLARRRAQRHEDHDTRLRDPRCEEGEQREGGRVCRVYVLEQQEDRLRLGRDLQQFENRLKELVARDALCSR
ncbi:MAG: hypothetical protein U0263_13880 [Polyangiaceae bacterium]